jgi:hypothetical protein
MFYFAWVDASETAFDPTIHNREDEDMFGFSVEHAEGEFAGLEIEIKNPRISLLAPARKVHAWMSCVSRERDGISATRSRNWRNPSVLRAARERTVSLVRARVVVATRHASAPTQGPAGGLSESSVAGRNPDLEKSHA